MDTFISTSSEWSFDLIEKYDSAIASIAQTYKLDTFPNQIEIITAEQMMDAYSSVGMPLVYNHWSFGKHFVKTQKSYQRGQMGLAYEIVINSNPCIAYLMEENTMVMQALVIAHACYGHNSFFKSNYLFKTWTNANSIIDYLLFAKNYIRKCEERYGKDSVEEILDACHALQNLGVDRYRRPKPVSATEEKKRQAERERILQLQVNDIWRTVPNKAIKDKKAENFSQLLDEPQENLLFFLEKNAPLLKSWQREIIRIVRKIAQYFYPQRQTQVMNEGWASFWHYTLINKLYDNNQVNSAFMFEFFGHHSNVLFQPDYDSPHFNGINPYALGFKMFHDIKRICQQPTQEDKHWFPEIAGTNWLETLDFAMRNFKDESFIQQFLSPKLIRDFHFFSLLDDEKKSTYKVEAIHDEHGYKTIRELLAKQYDLSETEPDIQAWSVNIEGNRSLTLRHTMKNNMSLSDETTQVLNHLYTIWGFDVHLETYNNDKLVKTQSWPEKLLDKKTNSKQS